MTAKTNKAEMEKAMHRMLMLETSQQLSSEEFNKLMYLLGVPDEEVETPPRDRTCLLRYLDKHQVVSPNNYECLLWALDTIQRKDIIKKITTENPEVVFPTLPYIPQSFGTQGQTWIEKRKVMLDKKDLYIGRMKDLGVLMHSGPARESRFGELFLRAFSILRAEQNQKWLELDLQESAAATLTQLSLFWKLWPITLATFQQNGDSCKIKPLMAECHDYFDRFNRLLPPNWDKEIRQQVSLQRDNVQHPIGKLAREAHGALHELSVELIGKQSLKEANKRLKEALFALESVNYTAKYLMPIYKWLFVLLHLASLSVIDVSKFHDTLKVIVSDHWPDMARNKDILMEIVGKEVMSRICQDLEDREGNGSEGKCDIDVSTYSSIVSSVSVVWHVAIVVLAITALNCEVDLKSMQKRLSKYMADQRKLMMQTYLCLSKRVAGEMQEEVDYYRENYAQKVRQVAGGSSEILEMLQSLFSHKEASVV